MPYRLEEVNFDPFAPSAQAGRSAQAPRITLEPVDFDPFAPSAQAGRSAQAPRITLEPVDFDPFAPSTRDGAAASAKAVYDSPVKPEQPGGIARGMGRAIGNVRALGDMMPTLPLTESVQDDGSVRYGMSRSEPTAPQWARQSEEILSMLGRGLVDTARKVWEGDADIANQDDLNQAFVQARQNSVDAQKFIKDREAWPEGLPEGLMSVPYSGVTMGASLAAGAAGSLGGPLSAGAAGMAASGTTAYRAAKREFKDQLLLHAADELGRVPTVEEWKDLEGRFETQAVKSGLWEAGPEAVGNLLFLKILGPWSKAIAAKAGAKLGAGVAGKIAASPVGRGAVIFGGTQAEEQLTEGLTGWGQGAAQAEAGLRDKAPALGEAYAESFAPTFWTTTITAGAGGLAQHASERWRGDRPIDLTDVAQEPESVTVRPGEETDLMAAARPSGTGQASAPAPQPGVQARQGHDPAANLPTGDAPVFAAEGDAVARAAEDVAQSMRTVPEARKTQAPEAWTTSLVRARTKAVELGLDPTGMDRRSIIEMVQTKLDEQARRAAPATITVGAEPIDLIDVAQLPITTEQAPNQPFTPAELATMQPGQPAPAVTPMLPQPVQEPVPAPADLPGAGTVTAPVQAEASTISQPPTLPAGQRTQEQAAGMASPGQQPSFEDMVKDAARWRGAARNLAREVEGDKRAALRLSKTTTKGDLDAYLMRKYGIDEAEARNVSNHLTAQNVPDDMTATVEEFKDEPWAKEVRKERPESKPDQETADQRTQGQAVGIVSTGQRPLAQPVLEPVDFDPFAGQGAVVKDSLTTDDLAHQAATSPINDLPEPTQAQEEAGNYKKGHVRVQGFDISVENPRGSERSGVDQGGQPWSVTMNNHYGYIKGTVGADKDHLDVFLGPDPETGGVFVVDQVDPQTGRFDEHKIMLGFPDEASARSAYQSNYADGWQGLGAITAMPMDEFRAWSKSKKTKRPVGEISGSTVKDSLSVGPAPTSQPAPAKQGRVKKDQAQRSAELADYYAVGNVVKGYGGHERVVAFVPSEDGGPLGWSVVVQGVQQDADGQWVNDGTSPRRHATQPSTREIAAGPVVRAGQPSASLDISAPAPDSAVGGQETQGGQDERGQTGQRGSEFGGLGQSEPGGVRQDVDGGRRGGGRSGLRGTVGTVHYPGGTEGFAYEVVESDTLVPSHDPRADFTPRADFGYTNERNYERNEFERGKVLTHALELNPGLLLAESPTAEHGAPLVDHGLRVLGGNSRAMTMQLAYDRGMDGAGRYKDALVRNAAKYGLNPDAVRGMSKPVLVRVLDSAVGRERGQELIPAFNQGFTQAVDPTALGVSRGAKVSDDSMRILSEGLADGQTLKDFLNQPAARRLVESLVEDGAVDKTRMTVIMRGGELTKDGKDEIARTIRGRIVGDYGLMESLQPSLLDALDAAVPALARLQARGEGWDIGKQVQAALRHVAHFRKTRRDAKETLDSYFRMPDMMGGIPGKKSRVVQILAHALNHMGHAQFGKAAAEYARLAFVSQPRSAMLPGMGQLLPTKDAALEKFRTPQTPEALFATTQAATQARAEQPVVSDSEKPNESAPEVDEAVAQEYSDAWDRLGAAEAARPTKKSLRERGAERRAKADVSRAPRPERVPGKTRKEVAAEASAKMADAAQRLKTGFAKINDVFSKYGGLSVREVKAGDQLNQDLYSELKPHLFEVFDALRDMGHAGADLVEAFAREARAFFGQNVDKAKPYFMKFVREEIATKGESNADGQPSSQSLERNSGTRADQDGVGEGTISPERRGDSAGGGAGRGSAGQRRRGPDDRAGLSRRPAAAAGTGSDSEIRSATSGTAGNAAGSELDQRGDSARDRGLAPEPVGDGAVADAARRSEERAAVGGKQTGGSRPKKADRDDIAQTLPALLPGQLDDVAFAERRFDAGAGVMFTNGTGTGKTGSGLGIIKRLVMAGKKNILIAVPSADIARGWVRFAKQFLGLDVTPLKNTRDAGQGVVVTTHANLGANAALASRQWDLLVMDEAHKLMSSEQANKTQVLDALRALALHKDGAYTLARMRRPDLFQAFKEAPAASDKLTPQQNVQADAARSAWRSHLADVRAEVVAAQGQVRARLDAPAEGRAGVVFLSATPFAYEPNVDYAEGFLFDYPATKDQGGYNEPSGYQKFMIEHFGYRMRTGKLNKPDANVDSGIMQRQFNSWLKKQGVLSSRLLDVDQDYDRKFVLVESAVGRAIDEGLGWLRSNPRMVPLLDEINKRFDHLARRYLLEAIKAREAVPVIRQNLALGRKVVVFHDYKQGGGFNPFDVSSLRHSTKDVVYYPAGRDKPVTVELGELAREFASARADLQNLPLTGLQSPLVTLGREFPDLLVLNGDVSAKNRAAALERFQDDDSGQNLIVVQSAAGEAGISLHDTTGRHQRVLINLGLPTRPVTAIQQEGRIFRVGQKSNAMFRYLNTGTNWERWAFASTIATRASTAENLSLGEEARALRDGFIEAFEESEAWVPGHEGEGTGGKERDSAARSALSEWDRAKTMYFGQQKKTSKTKAAEGVDYFATPEPLGLKMVEWAGITPEMDVLEPSAGHGAIARWFPDLTRKTMIEPSHELASRLALVADGRIVQERFEALHAVNKYDAIVMNPPYGTAGKMAMEHVAKAFTHLRDGGRLVALIPDGASMDKRLDAWYASEAGAEAHLRMTLALPGVTFERAGTGVRTRVVVIDKAAEPVGNVESRSRSEVAGSTIGEFFDNLEHRTAPGRIVTAEIQAKAEIEAGEAARGVFFDALETKHSKTGQPLYVASKTGLMSKEMYAKVAAVAKGLGGWWSKYDRDGAIPGFQFKDRSNRDEFLAEASKILADQTPAVHLSRASVTPWPKDFPKAFAHTTVSKVTDHVDYAAAKAGDLDAARRLVADVVKPERLRELVRRFPDAVVVPVAEVEAAGLNRIPYALAEALNRAGLTLMDSPIYETSGTKRKSLDAVQRLLARKSFAGRVVPGRTYILVDDILTQGGTIHELRTHIVNNGGEVVAVSSLAFSAGSNIVAIQQKTIDTIIARFGRENIERLLWDHNISGTIEALTDSEGRALARFQSLDALRTRIAAGGRTVFSRVHQEAVPAHQVHLGSQRLSVGRVQGIARAVSEGWRNGPPIQVVATVQDLPAPILDAVYKAGAEGDVQAAYSDNQIYLIADRMADANHIHRTLLHEAFVHHGLGLIMTPAERARALDAAGRNKTVQAALDDIAQTYGLDLNDVDQRREAVEEVLADWAESGVPHEAQTVMQRFVNAVRRALRRTMPGLRMSDAEIMELMASARRAVEEGKGVRKGEGVNFKRAKKTPAPTSSAPAPASMSAGLRRRIDYLRMKFQDKFLPLKRVQEMLQAQGWKMTHEADAYRAEELFHGRAGHRLEKFQEDVVAPLMDKIGKSGLSIAELEDYLYARYAPQRNAHIASINPKMPDGGSGRTNQWAADTLARFDREGKTTALAALARAVRRITQMQRDIIREEGLETEEIVDAWELDNPDYVPLKGGPHETGRTIGTGFNIKRSGTRRALGRASVATDILANLLAQVGDTIIRAEKARVGRAFLKMAEQNPGVDVWKIHSQLPMKRAMVNGQVGQVVDFSFPQKDHVLTVTLDDGSIRYVEVFDDDLARVMKNLTPGQHGRATQALAAFTRYLSMVNTSLNPEFIATNFERDLMTAAVHLSGEQSAAMAKKVVKSIPSALRGIGNYLRGDRKHEWAEWFELFRASGAQVSFMDLRGLDQIRRDIDAAVGQKGGSLAASKRAVRSVLNFIGDMNTSVENAVRLSAFRHAVESGLPIYDAASLAKNLTVNFNRKGELGPAMNALYMFFNAGVQGSARIVGALKSRKVQGMMAATVLLAWGLAELNRFIGGDDDDEENRWDKHVNDWAKQTNLVFMLPDGDSLKIRLPYGYNFFVATGYALSDVMHWSMGDGGKSPGQAALFLTKAAMNAFNPMGDDSMLQMLAPTVLDPFVQIATNENFMGNKIMPEQDPYGPPKPESQLHFRGASKVSRVVAEQVNALTGGDKWEPGAVDVSPEVLDHMVSFLTGGLGRTTRDVAGLPWVLSEPELAVRQVPFLRQVYQQKNERADLDRFYENARKIEIAVKRFNELPEDKLRAMKEVPADVRMQRMLKRTQKSMSAVRKDMYAAMDRDDKEKALFYQKVMQQEAIRFNKEYNRVHRKD